MGRPRRTAALGIGARILDVARGPGSARSGTSRVRLDTNRSLAEAQAMYRSRGYVEIPRYNDNVYANHWFEKALRAG